jgi:hypothetical protein
VRRLFGDAENVITRQIPKSGSPPLVVRRDELVTISGSTFSTCSKLADGSANVEVLVFVRRF